MARKLLPEIARRPSEISRLQRGIDRLFEDFFSPGPFFGQDVFGFIPPVDLEETDNEYCVSLDLPGVTKDDIHIDVHNNQLIISGERKEEKQEGKGLNYERYYGSFQRSFYLPSNVNADQVEATFHDGVLDVVVPKAEEAKPKRIQIQEAKKPAAKIDTKKEKAA